MPTNKSRKLAKEPPAAMKESADSPPVRKNGQTQKRVTELFSDIERLTGQLPADCREEPRKQAKRSSATVEESQIFAQPDEADMLRELEVLRARVRELETQLQQNGKFHSAPVMYEKEQVGYAFKENNLEPLRISTYKEEVNAPNAIRAPLIATGQTIGMMYVEPTDDRTWEPEAEDLVNTVAQQASLQIENLRLLAATERARTEAEAATRRFMHESWDSYLDAIHQNERIGYAYDRAEVRPYLDATQDADSYRETVKIMDEQIGILVLKQEANQPLMDEDRKLVSAVASQIAQQVENIRLLADASRARAEAEEATRRMVSETWQSFTEQRDTLGFTYDTVKVSPLGNAAPQNVTLSLPLQVRGETIGQLAVAGQENISPEAIDMATAIAAQASIHLEALRLTEELQKRAEELLELDRLKSGFLANMSHELRTPLNSILGFSEVMLEELDGPLTPNMSTDLKLIQKNGQHLLHLINDVLDMAKIESGRMNLHPEKFNVHEVLEEVNSITSTLASERNISLYIENDSDQEVEIVADNTRIRQVMINLVNNAIKFTEGGKIAIRASKTDNATVLIAVKDTGIGIPPEKLEDIFQEFTQVDTSTTRKVGGTGLGLPISRRLIEMHGGRLWAESTGVVGEGSTFFIELPLEAHITEMLEKREK